MASIRGLLNDKYILLEYVYHHSSIIKEEYVLNETIEEMAEKSPFKFRKLCVLMKELEKEGYLTKHTYNRKKYAIAKEGLMCIQKINMFIEPLKDNQE